MVGWVVLSAIGLFALFVLVSLVLGLITGLQRAPGLTVGVLLVFVGGWGFYSWGFWWWLGWFPLALGVLMIWFYSDSLALGRAGWPVQVNDPLASKAVASLWCGAFAMWAPVFPLTPIVALVGIGLGVAGLLSPSMHRLAKWGIALSVLGLVLSGVIGYAMLRALMGGGSVAVTR